MLWVEGQMKLNTSRLQQSQNNGPLFSATDFLPEAGPLCMLESMLLRQAECTKKGRKRMDIW